MQFHLVHGSLACLLLAACGGTGGGSIGTSTTASALTGAIDVRVTEPADDFDAPPATLALTQVVVTIDRVDVRVEDGPWTALPTMRTTVDLMAVRAASFASLGIAQLPAGDVDSLRLDVDPAGPNYVVTADLARHPLAVPSDAIRVVGDFDFDACATGHVTIAFAAHESTAIDTTTSTWVLRPVVRIEEATAAGTCADDAEHGGHAGLHHGQEK